MPNYLIRLSILTVLAVSCSVGSAQFWNPFGSKKEESKPNQQPVQQATFEAPMENQSFTLSQTSGPWLIMASTFSGEGAQQQATLLCTELVNQYGMKCYVHKMTFEFSKEGEQLGRGVDKYGDPIKMRYRSGSQREEWAVLVGDFTHVEDSLAEKQLAKIKSIQPKSLNLGQDGETSQNYAHIRITQTALLEKLGKKPAADGPMRSAFITRNPMLPPEYFAPMGVDKFVEKMNKGLKYSLLKADGRYTVKVATFKGRGILQGATSAKSSSAKRKKADVDPLAKAAADAHLLCEAMRRQGWEAYEFHDRDQSYVSVGSYDSVAKDGSIVPLDQITSLSQLKNDVLKAVETFGAQYNTPQVPIDERNSARNADSKTINEAKETFNQLFTSEVGQVAGGYNPKYAQVFVEKKDGRSIYRPITFDIRPELIEAPKKTVSSGFSWRR